MKNILLIGNGFDLAHGLKTSYLNLMDFLGAFKQLYESPIKDHPYDLKNQSKLRDELSVRLFTDARPVADKLYKLINENECYDFFEKYFESEHDIGWLDLEECLKKKVTHLIGEEHKSKFYNDLRNFTYAMELYFEAYFLYIVTYEKDIIKRNHRIKEIEDLNPDVIISYNYTNTYNTLYGSQEKRSPHIVHIHGQNDDIINIVSSKLVLGADIEMPDKSIEKFTKAYQRRHFLKIDSILDKLCIYGETNELYIYGHSLGENDSSTLLPLFQDDRIMYIHLYYTYNIGNTKDDLCKNINKLIEPLDKITKQNILEKIDYIEVKDR